MVATRTFRYTKTNYSDEFARFVRVLESMQAEYKQEWIVKLHVYHHKSENEVN